MTDEQRDNANEARRRLIKAGIYVVPAVPSVVVVRNAGAQTSPPGHMNSDPGMNSDMQ